MKLAAQETIERMITAAHADVAERRKRFLVDFLADASPESVARTLNNCPADERAFIEDCLEQTAHAA